MFFKISYTCNIEEWEGFILFTMSLRVVHDTCNTERHYFPLKLEYNHRNEEFSSIFVPNLSIAHWFGLEQTLSAVSNIHQKLLKPHTPMQKKLMENTCLL